MLLTRQTNAGSRVQPQAMSISAPAGSLDIWSAFKPHPLHGGMHAPAATGPDELNDDVLLEVLCKLDGRSRNAAAGACRRLRELAHGTFTHVTICIPPGDGADAGHDTTLGSPKESAPLSARLAAMTSATLLLPALVECSATQHPCGCPTDALDLFLDAMLPLSTRDGSDDDGSPALLLPKLESLRISPYNPGETTTCQVSAAALSLLAASAPHLRSLHLPVLSPTAAMALRLLPPTLTCLSLTVSDSPSLDPVVQLPALTHLSVSTREGLLYLVLSLSQVRE